jgi:hypothetical protein
MGQNCGGYRRSRLADRHQQANVCLIPNQFQAGTAYVTDFGTAVLLTHGILPFSVSKQIKQIFLCRLLCI